MPEGSVEHGNDGTALDDDSGMLGLGPGVVRLLPYTPRWAVLYQHEVEVLYRAFGNQLVDIEHFGSTAVPGIHAKPILDLLGGVVQIDDPEPYQSSLAAVGYEYAWWIDLPDHLVFGKGRPRTHLLYLVEHGGLAWRDGVRFRNALRDTPELAVEYDTFKRALLERYATDPPAYTQAKMTFIQRVLGHGAGPSPVARPRRSRSRRARR